TATAPFVQYFTVAPVGGFIEENRRTNDVAITSLSLSPSNQLDGSFSLNSSTAGGGNLYSIAQADFNSDGYLDLAAANWSLGCATVFTNDRTGHFNVLTNIPTGANPIGVITADFNNDSNADIAVANYNSGTVSILLGNGAGGFTL